MWFTSMFVTLTFITPFYLHFIRKVSKPLQYIVIATTIYLILELCEQLFFRKNFSLDASQAYFFGFLVAMTFRDLNRFIPSNFLVQILSASFFGMSVPFYQNIKLSRDYKRQTLLLSIPLSILFLVSLKAGKRCLFNFIYHLKIFKILGSLSFIAYTLQLSFLIRFSTVFTIPLKLYCHPLFDQLKQPDQTLSTLDTTFKTIQTIENRHSQNKGF